MDLERVTNLLSTLAPNNKIRCRDIVIEPRFNDTNAQSNWRLKNWGTIEEYLDIMPTSDGFAIISPTPNLSSFLCNLSKKYKCQIQYKYSGNTLDTNMGSYEIAEGVVMQERSITKPERFLCSVWNIDADDYYSKLRTGTIDAQTALINSNQVAMNDLDLIDSVLDGEVE